MSHFCQQGGVNQDGQMNSQRPYFVGRSPRPDSAPHFRHMQQLQHPNHQQHPQFQQFQQQHQQQLNSYNNNPAMGVNHYQAGQPNMMGPYSNGHMTPAGVSPSPSVHRMGNQSGMQVSPAVAATAPQHFGPQVCHQQQLPQAQQKPQQTTMYNNCPVQQPVANAPMMPAQQSMGCNVQQAYPQPNYANQTGPMPGSYNTGNFAGNNNMQQPCNNAANMMSPGSGYVMNHQCNPAPGYTNPCSPCNGHHHQQPVCNNNNNMGSPAVNNWQPCYPAMPQQQQQQHMQQSMPFQQQQTPAWNGSAMPVGPQGQPVMYNMQTPTNGAPMNNYNGYPRPPPYGQQGQTLIQCQDVSQSQDVNRVQSQEAGQPNQAGPIAPAAAQAPGNMRPETYQRTLEYVQQCQTWATGTDKVAKENKPPQSEPVAKATETAAAAVPVTAVARALLSPGQDAVSSSTDPQDAGGALQPSTGSSNNMIVGDMNSSLNQLMQENRFLQLIQ